MKCVYCESENIVKNGTNRVGTPKYKCKECSRQFVENPKNKLITEYEKELIDKLLLERLSLAGISRVLNISEPWIQNYVNNKFKNIEQTLKVSAKTDLDLVIECDELCTFVKKKSINNGFG